MQMMLKKKKKKRVCKWIEFDKCVCGSVFFSDLCVECEELIEGGIVNDFEVESKLLFDYGVHHDNW
jgi:hypothetical protein